MANRRKAEIEENANRITNWLVDNRVAFESKGIPEDSLITGVGIKVVDDARSAIDHLESHEVVVRDPEALTRPPRFTVRTGRNWVATRDKLIGAGAAGGSK